MVATALPDEICATSGRLPVLTDQVEGWPKLTSPDGAVKLTSETCGPSWARPVGRLRVLPHPPQATSAGIASQASQRRPTGPVLSGPHRDQGVSLSERQP